MGSYNLYSLTYGELDLSEKVLWRGKPNTLYKLRVIPLEAGYAEVTAHVYIGVGPRLFECGTAASGYSQLTTVAHCMIGMIAGETGCQICVPIRLESQLACRTIGLLAQHCADECVV